MKERTQKPSTILFSSFLSLSLVFGFLVAPAKAELSPDAGLEPEEIAVQEAEQAELDKQAEADAKAAAAEKKHQEQLRAAAKAKADAAAKAKAAAEEARKNNQVVATSEILPSNLFGLNVSVMAKDLPEGLTPKILSSALSVKAGQKASVTVKTLPGAACTIEVFVVTRTPVVAAGLESKQADADGLCSWTWTVKSTTKRGSWGVKLSAAKDGKSDDTWTTLNVGAVH